MSLALTGRLRQAIAEGHTALREVREDLRDLRAAAWPLARRTGRLVRASGGIVAFTALAAAAMCVATLAGDYSIAPLGVAAFLLGIGAAATVGKRSLDEPARVFRVGALVLATVLPPIGAVLCGARLADAHGEPHYVAGWALFSGVTLLGTLVLLPLLEAAPRLALGASGVDEAFAAALVATGRRGLFRTLLVCALVAGSLSIVPLLDALGPLPLFGARAASPDFREAAAVLAAGMTLSFVVLLSVAGLLATERFAVRRRARSAFAIVTAGIVLLAAATAVGATLMPRGWRRVGTLEGTTTATPGDLSVVMEGAALVVRDGPEERARVSVPLGYSLYGVLPEAHGTYSVLIGATAPEADRSLYAIRIDAEGHRVDDGPLARLYTHVDVLAGPTFWLAAFLVAFAFLRARPRARLHRAVRRGTESVLVGKLVTDEGAPLSVEGGVARTSAWRIEAPDAGVIVSLPPALAVLGSAGPLVDGQSVELVSPDPIRGLSFRDGATPCPQGAVLLVGADLRRDEIVEPWAVAPAGWPLALASLAAVAGTVLALGGSTILRADLDAARDVSVATIVRTRGPVTPAPPTPPPPPRRTSSPAHFRPSVDLSTDPYELNWALRQERILRSRWAADLRATGPMLTTVSPELVASPVLAAALEEGVTLDAGMVLLHVDDGALLGLLGFRTGDVILEVAGVPVTRSSLAGVLRENRRAGHVGVRISRAGRLSPLVLQLAEVD